MRLIKAEVEGKGWRAVHAPEKGALMDLSFDGSEAKLLLDGVAFGSLLEKDAIVERVVRHDYLENDGCSVEATSVVPFGVEPAVSRKFEYYLNTVRVRTDVSVRAVADVLEFDVDHLRLSRNWKRFAVIPGGAASRLPNEPAWKEIDSSTSRELWKSDAVFAAILFESDNGERLEIGTGMDLWRWNAANSYDGAVGKFSLAIIDDEIRLRRSVLVFPVETELEYRDWRFNWYVAWRFDEEEDAEADAEPRSALSASFPDTGVKPPRIEDGVEHVELSLPGIKWPKQALRSWSDGNTGVPCFRSKLVRNHFRKTVRKIAAAAPPSLRSLTISGLEPGFCDNAGHLERAKRGSLPHWDLPDIVAFHLWASRLLRKKGVSFEIVPGRTELLSELPSLQCLRGIRRLARTAEIQ